MDRLSSNHVFLEFTPESVAKVENYLCEGQRHQDESEGYQEEVDKKLKTGMKLPQGMKFPKKLAGKPIEDIDPFYRAQMIFMVINRKKNIERFTAKKALFLLSPFNPVRRLAIYILTHQLFSILVMLTILTNCVFMTMTDPPKVTEYVFTAMYTAEAIIKLLARGVILDKFTYFRDPWNWLDFVVIILAYITMTMELGNLSGLRTLRVLRALKSFSVLPGLKTIVKTLIQSVKRLRDIAIMASFILSVFALVGLQLYMGSLLQKCVSNIPSELNVTDEIYAEFIHNSSNWVVDASGEYMLCGNISGARHCSINATCLPNIGMNPNDGYTSFDSFSWALLSAFRLMTRDFWEGLCQLMITAEGPWHVVYFVIIIFMGSFYMMNLVLAIVHVSYKEQKKTAREEAEEEKRERKRSRISGAKQETILNGREYHLGKSTEYEKRLTNFSGESGNCLHHVCGVCSCSPAWIKIQTIACCKNNTNCLVY